MRYQVIKKCRSKPWPAIVSALLFLSCACSAGAGSGPRQPGPPTAAPASTEALTTLTPGAGPGLETPAGIGPRERWIEVSLPEQVVRLHDGDLVVAEYLAATGVGDRPEYTTYAGLFQVRRKYAGPVESAPGVYVTNVLEFDLEHGNGIHSLPVDENGHVLDDRLGQPMTAGCVRVAESEAVFNFATLGMKVWVH